MADLYLAQQMHELFMGMETAHGEFYPGEKEGLKQKGRSTTLRLSVSDDLWLKHLDGNIGLGIIPINEQSECFWGVIDIDNYELDLNELLKKIQGTPLIACKSKSGGVHLFVFCKHSVKAKYVREYLIGMNSQLGLGNSEVFPKQETIHADRGDAGNWLNMPYFGPSRYCIKFDYLSKDNGHGLKIQELTLTEFINYIRTKRVDRNFFDKGNQFDYDKSPIEAGPPCLQVMSINGFPAQTRNVSLFNIGIYCKRAVPDEWNVLLHSFNKEFFNPPLSEKEVTEVIKSLNKKSYSYQCNAEPLCSFCNAKLCRTRKYGIASTSSLPIITSLTKVVGDTSMWFLDIEGERMELTTEELYDFKRFSIRCLNTLNVLPSPMKSEQWFAWIQSQIEKAIEIKDDVMFASNELTINFIQFLTSRLCQEREDVSNNRVWYESGTRELYFKLEAFISFLRFRRITLHKGVIYMYFKGRGCHFINSKSKDRKSYRHVCLPVTQEEEMLIELKQGKGDVL